MKRVAFVCHGNICRSPMAEFLFKKMVKDMNIEKEFYIESFATSSEEIGNPIHYGTKKILDRFAIDYSQKRAKKLSKKDYNKFDLFIGMDSYNVANMARLFGEREKVYKLLDFVGSNKDVQDPWYTGDFETTYQDVMEGLNGLINYFKRQE